MSQVADGKCPPGMEDSCEQGLAQINRHGPTSDRRGEQGEIVSDVTASTKYLTCSEK